MHATACTLISGANLDIILDVKTLAWRQAAAKEPKRVRRSAAGRRGATGRRDPRTTSSIFRGVTKHRHGRACKTGGPAYPMSRLACTSATWTARALYVGGSTVSGRSSGTLVSLHRRTHRWEVGGYLQSGVMCAGSSRRFMPGQTSVGTFPAAY